MCVCECCVSVRMRVRAGWVQKMCLKCVQASVGAAGGRCELVCRCLICWCCRYVLKCLCTLVYVLCQVLAIKGGGSCSFSSRFK